MTITQLFSNLFGLALVLNTVIKLWLAHRQIQSISRHQDQVPMGFENMLSLADHQKAAAYSQAKLKLSYFNIMIDAIYIAGLTFGGGLNFIAAYLGSSSFGTLTQGILLFGIVSVLGFVIDLPFTLIRTFHIEAKFGFNKLTPKLFCLDLLKGTLLGCAIGIPLLALVLWLIPTVGPYWWLWTWVIWTVFSLVMMIVYPLWIAPLFNQFTVLADGELKDRIVALLTRTGFTSNGIYVMDGSKRSSHGNAYFTGFGSAKRIVFFDTLLEKLSPEETEAVLAHELGHFKRNHIKKRLGIVFLSSFVFLFILGQLINAPWFYHGLHVEYMSNAMALLLFSTVLPVFTFLLTPLSSYGSRKHEYEADAFAASESSANALIQALGKLYRDNASTLTPDPVFSSFYDSHPPASLRIEHLKRFSHD